MRLLLGTDDGVWEFDRGGVRRLALPGKRVTHVAQRGALALAVVPREGLHALLPTGAELRFEGDARSGAVGPDGALYVGVEPAMIHRLDPGTGRWRRLGAIDGLPTRNSWSFPVPPHEPHVLSIDFPPNDPDAVLAGVEVGGVILSRDRGETWYELNEGVYADVHSVRADPAQPGLLVAVTGNGFYASEDGGGSWERRMDGVGNTYTIGLHVNPLRAREVLVSAGDRPPGLNGRLYHTLDAGKSWSALEGEGLPAENHRAPVPFFHEGSAWIATDRGLVLRATDPRGHWALVHELPTRINAVAGDGSPSSVMH